MSDTTSQRFAWNISAHEAIGLAGFPDTIAVISINEEHEPNHKVVEPKSGAILRLKFSDVLFPMEHDGKILSPIDGDKALEIVNFIEKHKDKNFIVHCYAGISRSSAVCLYIHIKYGHALKERFWQLSQPNPVVLGRLFILSEVTYE